MDGAWTLEPSEEVGVLSLSAWNRPGRRSASNV